LREATALNMIDMVEKVMGNPNGVP